MLESFQVLLLSCYEMGHQPLSLAWPLAWLRPAGFQAAAVDLAVSPFPAEAVRAADLVAIAVPMHTAMRLGVAAARRVRTLNPGAHIIFYGLYAWLNASFLLAENGQPAPADSVVAGEVEPTLLALAQALAAGQPAGAVPGVSTSEKMARPVRQRLDFPVPDRQPLPPVTEYAHYIHHDRAVPAGYAEASRGCLHTCTHCPVVPVYQGRFFVVPAETVLADVAQQVAAGAQHITFGDPDFLNGPGHALMVARRLHHEFPRLTFDFTTKVEHILKHRRLFPELAEYGATFVVSAFEATREHILARLEKGHSPVDMDTALEILADAGLAVQPTWVPFTPWTTMDDYLHLLEWIRRRQLVAHVPAVQLSIRLLVPPQSALLDHEDVESWRGPLDSANFTYRWTHPDPCMDELQQVVAGIAEQADGNPYMTFNQVERTAYALAGREPPQPQLGAAIDLPPPRLSEDWFC